MLAGVPFFDEVFRQLDCTVDWTVNEGSHIDTRTSSHRTAAPDGTPRRMHCATVRGPARRLLLGERVALNALARCSGIATKSAALLARVRAAGYRNILAGTRKTTPGFRLPEKYAMLVGGVDAHRLDLSAMTMLKDNHIAACGGSIEKAVAAAKAAGGFAVKVEVECQSEADAERAIEAGADVVMLDNFEGDGVRAVSKGLKDRWRGRRDFLIEVSGGLTEENLKGGFLGNDVDIISTSSIHQGVPHVDFSLKIVEGQARAEVQSYET